MKKENKKKQLDVSELAAKIVKEVTEKEEPNPPDKYQRGQKK